MQSFLKVLFILLSVLLLETSVFPKYLMPAFKPDLLLVIMVFLALRAPLKTSLPSAYGLGLLIDCVGGIYLGLNAFSFLAVYIVLKSLSDLLYVRNGLLFVLTVTAVTAGVLASNLLLLAIFSQAPGLLSSIWNSAIPHILVNAFVASLLAALPVFSATWPAK